MKKKKFNTEGSSMTTSKEVKSNGSSKSKNSSKRTQKDTKKGNVWLRVESTEKYRNYVALVTCCKITESLKLELLDGVSIVLNERNSNKSEKKKRRIMRRIVEKRQAQAAHQKLGRTKDLFVTNIERSNVSRCMYEFM